MQENNKDLLLEIYSFLHIGILDKTIKRINLAQNGQGKTLEKFHAKLLKKFGENIGSDWMVDYCLYQVHYWHDKTVQNKLTLGWTMGDKALDRYLKRPQGKSFYEDKMLKRKLGLTREELKDKWRKVVVDHPLMKYKHTPQEDAIKKQFLNQDVGYYQCLTMTTMISDSEVCKGCRFTEECKKSLKKFSPELARVRGM
jgi:hypothetical protein